MKIAIVTDSLELSAAGGVGSFVYELCRALALSGQRVLIIGIIGNEQSTHDSLIKKLVSVGVEARCLSAKSRRDALVKIPHWVNKLRQVLNIFADGEKIVCNVHLKLGVLVGSLASVGNNNIAVVETYHSQYSHYKLQTILLSQVIKKVVCCSESAYNEYVHRFGRNSAACSVPNGIDMNAVRQIAKREKNQQVNRKILFYSVGRLTRQKNLTVSIEAFINSANPESKYYIIGEGEDKDKLLISIGNNHDVELLGSMPRNDVLRQISNADMVVMPSLWEGLSIFQLEALALGCPMMLSDISAFRQIFHEEKLGDSELFRICQWGYLVQTNNVVAWEKAFEHFYSNYYMKEKMQNAVLDISKEYDISTTVGKYLNVFNDAIER